MTADYYSMVLDSEHSWRFVHVGFGSPYWPILVSRCFKAVEQIESETDMIEVQERAADVPEDSECAVSEGDQKRMHSARVLRELCEAANLRGKSQGLIRSIASFA